MRKYKKRTSRIELLIKHSIPKSSSWHNLLSITFRNYFLQRQINTWLQYCKPPNCAKNNRISKCCIQGPAQNRTNKPNLSSKRSKLLLAPKCIYYTKARNLVFIILVRRYRIESRSCNDYFNVSSNGKTS